MKAIILALFMLLSACAGNQPIQSPPKVVEVSVPVIVECLKEHGEKPNFISDAALIAIDDEYSRMIALHYDRLDRDAYIAELEAAVEGCKL